MLTEINLCISYTFRFTFPSLLYALYTTLSMFITFIVQIDRLFYLQTLSCCPAKTEKRTKAPDADASGAKMFLFFHFLDGAEDIQCNGVTGGREGV
ncbi:MAG: hypothetical protein IKU95_01290, partial [Clostridia bacterium]|nr:hypothetical protein [Clostridia bacterium]